MERVTDLYRRDLIAILAGSPLAGLLASPQQAPGFLESYRHLYAKDPRGANVEWFRNARFGLFIHYGLYSLDGVHPFHQHRLKIPVAEYETRMHRFKAERFDADHIAALAAEAGMRYVTLVTKHCDGFCLWNTRQTGFNSMRSAAKRDLVAEMSEACRKRRLGLFLFYEHGFDWRHPHGPRYRDFPVRLVEVPYDTPEPFYAQGNEYNLQRYVEYVSAQITELMTNYGPIAGIWLDGVAVPRSGDASKFHLPELYNLIRRLQTHTLVCYKVGVTGTEDYLAPERPQLKLIKERSNKPLEICIPLNPGWGYVKDEPHMSIDKVLEAVRETEALKANLLLNIGPLGDGSVYPQDEATLRALPERIRQAGMR